MGKLAVAKAPFVNHQIAEPHQASHRHHRNQGGNHKDLVVAPQTNAEATSTTMVNCLEDWQLARRNAVKLEGSMGTSGPMLPRTARVTGRAIAPKVIRRP